MLSQLLVFYRSMNFTSNDKILIPPTNSINHYFSHPNQQKWPTSSVIIPCYDIQSQDCFEHSNFLKVNTPRKPDREVNPKRALRQNKGSLQLKRHKRSLEADTLKNPTTSFLTATTLAHAIGAGITAAAGTRLALQLILVKRCKLYSFQLQD